MKKLVLASAIAALSIVSAQAAPTVYGKAFLTLDIKDGDKNSADNNSRSQLTSNASRIGIKGSEALTANTDVVYQLEYRVEMDEDNGGDAQFVSRDTYLGLSNKQFGTVVAGRLTAIDDYINYAKVVEGGIVGGSDVLATFNGNRANNAFAYFSPNYQGVQFMGMYVMDENKAGANDGRDSLLRDAWGLGAKYEPANAPLKAGVTYIKAGVNKTNNATFDQAIRGSVAYAINPALTVAGQVQVADGLSSVAATKKEKEKAYTISGSYKVAQTPWVAYGQLDFVDNANYTKNAERQRLAVGGKYNFNKNAIAHVYGAYMKSENIGVTSGTKADSYGVGAGLEYKF